MPGVFWNSFKVYERGIATTSKKLIVMFKFILIGMLIDRIKYFPQTEFFKQILKMLLLLLLLFKNRM